MKCALFTNMCVSESISEQMTSSLTRVSDSICVEIEFISHVDSRTEHGYLPPVSFE